MTDAHTLMANLRRPRLLIKAARLGLAEYQRERDLRRLLRGGGSDRSDHVLHRLLTEEHHLEASRTGGDASYSLLRHIEFLVAIMSEMRLAPDAALPGPSDVHSTTVTAMSAPARHRTSLT